MNFFHKCPNFTRFLFIIRRRIRKKMQKHTCVKNLGTIWQNNKQNRFRVHAPLKSMFCTIYFYGYIYISLVRDFFIPVLVEKMKHVIILSTALICAAETSLNIAYFFICFNLANAQFTNLCFNVHNTACLNHLAYILILKYVHCE